MSDDWRKSWLNGHVDDPVYVRVLPDGTFERIEKPDGAGRVVGRIVNIDKENGVVTFTVSYPHGRRDTTDG